MADDKNIHVDRMRYTKNKASSNLAIIAILFDVFFFVNIYKSNVGSYYYTALMGISIVYNLLFMLAAFLCSEEIKNYSEKYSYFIGVIGIAQFVRIFILPMKAFKATVTIQKQTVQVMGNSQFMKCVIYLCISGVCCLVAAAIGVARSRTLNAYLSTLGVEARRD